MHALLIVLLFCTGQLLAFGALAASKAEQAAVKERVEAMRAQANFTVAGERIAAREMIAQFYERRKYEPFWDERQKPETLLQLVRDSATHGLDPKDYHGARLPALARPRNATQFAERELLYTDAAIRLAYNLYYGKVNPHELYAAWNFSRTLGSVKPVEALEAMMNSDDLRATVEGYAPDIPPYQALRKALKKYREIEAAGGWPGVPAGPTLKPGMRDARVAALRQRLAVTGDLQRDAANGDEFYDENVQKAVHRFQILHGIEPDGVLGGQTLQALNVPVEKRIQQIRVNLERMRWMAQELSDRYLLVDIAGFNARLFVKGEPVWASRVVVGKPYRKTPMFRSTMSEIVLNPDWTVPPTILREDLLPKAQNDADFFARKGMRVKDRSGQEVDASTVSLEGGDYSVVQPPGPDNPLGRVKFNMPNEHAIYLHDTPSKELFDSAQRALSSGCIRLEKPRELAVLLLDDPAQWSRERVDAAIEAGQTQRLHPRVPTPVLLTYFTADADEQGFVYFRSDLYRRDPQVLKGLEATFRFSPVRAAKKAA